MKKKATVHDVAKLAETSATTVSRVLSNNGYPVKETLRNKVISAARELNYTPNLLAKNLKENKSRDIGVIVPTITNPFYSYSVLGMEEEVNKNDYNLLLCNTLRDPERESKYLRMMQEKQVKGIVLSSVGESALIVNELIKQGIKFVLLDQKLPNDQCSHIGFDVLAGALMGAEYLIQCGHEKIAFVSTPINRWTRQKVFQGYKQAMRHAGIHCPMENEEEGYEVNAGRLMGKKFIQNKIDATAVMMINDMMAFGFIQELQKNGINVPEDVSVMGFDDIPFASLFSPALTTICYPSLETGKLAAKVLFERMNSDSDFVLNVRLEPKLIVRNSVKDLRKQ
jgi:LacI family transcriptional regulator